MKTKIGIRIRNLIACNANRMNNPTHPDLDLDLQEEYANAFRTESYNEFWTRVLAFSNGDCTTCKTVGSTSSSRLPSYRIFVDSLLDPDQSTVTHILTLTRNHPHYHPLLSNYFSKTADASLLCGQLLKDIDHTRVKYRSLKTTIQSLQTAQFSSINHLPLILTRLTEFSNSFNPFVISEPSPRHLQAMKAISSELLKELELSREKTQAKLRIINKLKHGSTIFLMALTVSFLVVVATHGLAILVAAPSFIVACHELASAKRLAKWSTQLDAAAKGTYILNRDMDTISRLVARLNDDLEHMGAMVRFWLKRRDDRLQASGEVVRQLKISDLSFSEQLDELEEHLYLCFMTINRARNLVMKEILDPGRPSITPLLCSFK